MIFQSRYGEKVVILGHVKVKNFHFGVFWIWPNLL